MMTPLLDENWVVAVNKEIDAMPDDLFATPDYVGRMDAADGIECRPLYYFARLGDIEMYIIGWTDEMAHLAQRGDAIEDDYDFIRHGGA